MKNTLKIGKYIRMMLLNSNEFCSQIQEKNIYPLVAPADTKFPYIVYQRTGLQTENTKDGGVEDIINFEIVVCSDNYTKSLDLINTVRNVLTRGRYRDDEIKINDIRIESVSEEFSEDTFIQRIIFQIFAE